MLRVLGFGNMRKDEPCEDLYSLPVAVWKVTEFIHSFITWIYVAPFQCYYSKALPTRTRLKEV